MHLRYCLGAVSAAVLILGSAQGQELTEQEAVRLFLTRSPSAQESRAGTAILEAQTRAWRLWPNPRTHYDHEGAGLTQIARIEQNLPLNGRRGLLREAGVAAVHAAESQAEFNVWELCSDMRQAFYELLLAQEREAVLRESLTQLEEVVRILGEREKHGEGSLFDRLRAEREQADLLAEIASAQAGTAQARSRLASFFGGNIAPGLIRAGGEFRIASELPPLEEVLPIGLEHRRDYQAEKQRQEQFRWEERAADRLRIPDPVFFAGFKRAESLGGIAYGPYVAFSVPLPIFDRGQARIAELEAELRRSAYREEVLDQQIQSAVQGAYETIRLRRRAAGEYRLQSEQQGAQLIRIAEVAYQEGELGILELLDAYRIRRQSMLRTVELTAAAKQAEIDLERAVGRPLLNQEVLP